MQLAFWKKKDNNNTKDKKEKKKKPAWREWFDAAIFALVAATIIRTFFFEAYTIPTSSMEGSLLVNDYMFVSKLAYGPRMPNTPLSFPLVHNTLPVVGGKSYSTAVQWKYKRLPGFRDIARNDVVVFNFPNNDTFMTDRPSFDYYGDVREYGRAKVWNRTKIDTHPVDKRENYVKRAVAIPGDVLEIKDGILYVNNADADVFPHIRKTYEITTDKRIYLSEDQLKKKGKVFVLSSNGFTNYTGTGVTLEPGRPNYLNIEKQVADQIATMSGVISCKILPLDGQKGQTKQGAQLVFPHDPTHFPFNGDNYGPITVPKKGVTITLSPENYALYDRIIRIYEGNTITANADGTYTINGQQTNQYTFKMDYYWMMGDNRHMSLDSRYWGFVPEDHVVGTPSFVWLSYADGEDNGGGIRWSRIFRGPKTLEQ